MLKILGLLLALTSPAAAAGVPPYYGVVQSTITGRAIMNLAGLELISASSQTASTPTIALNGILGAVYAKELGAMGTSGIKVSSPTTHVSSVTITAAGGLGVTYGILGGTMSITGAASVGSLTATGQVTVAGSTLSVQGAGEQVGSTSLYIQGQFRSLAGDKPGIFLGYDSGAGGIIAANTDAAGQPIGFWTFNGSSWGERLRIDSAGHSHFRNGYTAISSGTIKATSGNGVLLIIAGGATDESMVLAGSPDAPTRGRLNYRGYSHAEGGDAWSFQTNAGERMLLNSGGATVRGQFSVAGGSATIRVGADLIFQVIDNGGVLQIQTLNDARTVNPALKLSAGSYNFQTGAAILSGSTGSPASGAACTAGTVNWDADYIYVCTASGAWKRTALTGGY